MMEEKHNSVAIPQEPAVKKVDEQPKPKKKGKKLSKKTYLLIVVVGVVVIALITVAILMSIPRGNGGSGEGEDNQQVSANSLTTEEENAQTKQILDKYVEADIQGYQKVDNDDGLNDVVVINIKNISDEKTNLALDVVALDDNENVLDITSLYAEGIEPGQTQIFQAFALSELTPDQLKKAHYKIYRANTYQLDMPQETQTETQEEETQAEEAE